MADGSFEVKFSAHDECDYEQLSEWRADDRNFLGWRWDSASDEEYYDNNQYSQDDASEMSRAGVPMVTNNRIARMCNDVIGLQASQLTDWMVRTETAGSDDMVAAIAAKLKTAERTSKANRACLKGFASQIKAGIGWLEVCRDRNPFHSPYKVREVPWREMWWDWRCPVEANLNEAAYVRRCKWQRVDVLQASFPNYAKAIEKSFGNDDESRQLIEPQQRYRSFESNSWRDPPLTWNLTKNMHRSMRFLEEVWYQVQIEGPVVTFQNGRVMDYATAMKNPMGQIALKSGFARVEDAPYSRWRQAFWIGELNLLDRWSPYPFEGPPYIPMWGYREAMTGVPYGLIRISRSLQDIVNNLESRIIFSMSAVRVKVREGSTDVNELRRTVGDKRAVIVIDKLGEMDDVQIDEHIALNEQHMRVLDSSIQSLEAITGTNGLNPGSMAEGKPRSAAQAQALALRAMATLGEIQDNYQDARTECGIKLMALVREDLVKKGGAAVQIRKITGEKKIVQLHRTIDQHLGCDVVDNDVTMFNAEVVLDDVPHTATFRSQQFEKIADVLSTMPPEAVDVRRVMVPELVRNSDLPHADDLADKLAESAGLMPPQTPEAQAAAQAQQQDAAEQKEMQKQLALSQINKNNAAAQDHQASAARKTAEAKDIETPDVPQTPEEQDEALLEREKKVTHIAQIRAKTAKTLADTANATQQQKGIVMSGW